LVFVTQIPPQVSGWSYHVLKPQIPQDQ